MSAEIFFALNNVGVRAHGDAARWLLSGVAFNVMEGERVALVGRSGAGKTTLLRLLNRMADPAEGTIDVCGKSIERYLPSDLRRLVGWVAQTPAWLPGKCRHNLLAAHHLGLLDVAQAERRLPAVSGLAGVESAWLDRGEDELSVGQKQRVMLGRALLTGPRALLLDEPTSALDPPGARDLLKQVVALGKAEHLTMLLVTHRFEDARLFADRTIVLDGGRVVDDGPTAAVLPRLEESWESPGNP